MLPPITKTMKKNSLAEPPLLQQWDTLQRELESAAKLAIKKIPQELFADFNKVCRLKAIPDFYANYFLLALKKAPPETLPLVLAAEIEQLMTAKSFFHRITQALAMREQTITSAIDALHVVEGFCLMNNDKPVPQKVKVAIDRLVQNCDSLQSLKQVEKSHTEALALKVIEIRKEKVKLMDLLSEWRKYLSDCTGGSLPSKIKVVFPYAGMDCTHTLLEDTAFLSKSVLKAELHFGKEKYDPFLLHVSRNRRHTQVQTYFMDSLLSDTTDYSSYAKALLQLISQQKQEQAPPIETTLVRSSSLALKREGVGKEKQLNKEKKDKHLRKTINIDQLISEKPQEGKAQKEQKKNKRKRVMSESILPKSHFLKVYTKHSNLDDYQRKLDKYQQEIQQLKSQIEARNDRINIPQEALQISKVSKKSLPKGNKVNELEILLEEENSKRKQAETSLKQLRQEKQKMEKLINSSNNRADQEQQAHIKKLSNYEQEISRLRGQIESPRMKLKSRDKLNVIQQGFRPKKSLDQTVKMNLLECRLEEENSKRRNLQTQLRQLEKQKQAMEREVAAGSKKMQQERQVDVKKLQKYEGIIHELQAESATNKKIIKELKESKREKKERKSESIQQKKIRESHEEDSEQEERDSMRKDVQIIKTKKTIEIVFESRRHKENNLVRKLQQGQLMLEKKLKMKDQSGLREDKLEEVRMEKQLKSLRKSINEEFEEKLKKQRERFEREKGRLMKKIEEQKKEKSVKQKHLEGQVKFLKQMQRNQNELIKLLEFEKAQRREKERQLLREVHRREELLAFMEVQQIKRDIEAQARQELQTDDDDPSQADSLQAGRLQLEQEIHQLKIDRDQELQEMDQQNNKLKNLIERIKNEERELFVTIKQDIEADNGFIEGTEADNGFIEGTSLGGGSRGIQTVPQLQSESRGNMSVDETLKELEMKTSRQLKVEERRKGEREQMQDHPDYRHREKVEQLVEFYLQSPHVYPPPTDPDKQEVAKAITNNSKLAHDFQQELFATTEMAHFVPKDDSLTNHLLQLREVYDDYQADALRRQLFPPLRQESAGDDLSVESKEVPPVSLMDHVKLHLKKHSPKKESNKNFLAINRMKLMQLETIRRQKQRSLIKEESERKVKRMAERNLLKKGSHQKKHLQKKQHSKQRDQKKQKLTQEQQPRKEKLEDLEESEQQQNYEEHFMEAEMKEPHSDRQEQPQMKKQEQPQMKKQEQREEQGRVVSENLSAMQDDLFSREKQMLTEDIHSYQSQIRSYISSEERFGVYQQFIAEEQFEAYLKQITRMDSMDSPNEAWQLNSNSTILQDIWVHPSLSVLIAKDHSDIEIGIGVFHKASQAYLCDYLLSHNMKNFLNLAFNLTRFLFKHDAHAAQVEFLFDLSRLEDPVSRAHFAEFEARCRRLGEVYVRAHSLHHRKYVLKRVLFQERMEESDRKEEGLHFELRGQVHEEAWKEKMDKFVNKKDPAHGSSTTLLAYFLKNHSQKLADFRSRSENDLKTREFLLTALLFQKKGLQIKEIQEYVLQGSQNIDIFDIAKYFEGTDDRSPVTQSRFYLDEKLPAQTHRCTLEVGDQPVNYLVYTPAEPVTRIQSSNSSETGTFLSLMPKYKLLLLEAQEYLAMSANNPDLTAFSYVRHFIKNISDIKKEVFARVYLPEVAEDAWSHLDELSARLKQTVFIKQDIRIGWDCMLGNSVVYTPKHKDLVIQKPVIVALLSANIERAMEGTPIIIKLID